MNFLENLFPTIADIPAEHNLEQPVHIRNYLLNGEVVEWHGAMQEVYSPIKIRTESGELQPKLIGSYPLVGEKEAREALASAEQAYENGTGKWATMSVPDRIKCVEKFTQMMKTHRAIVVKLLMWEISKSLSDSEKEFDRTVEYIYATLDKLKKLDRKSSQFNVSQGVISQVRSSPLGIVLCMGPYNYPLNETFTLFIPALLMGNIVLFKPPRQGVLLHSFFQEAFQTCFPKGVINYVYGRGSVVVPPIMASGKVDCLAFIGSSRMADSLQKSHPKVNRLRSVLGLDAKNAAIILESADLEITVKEVVMGALSYNGQRCTAIKIVHIHKSLLDKFLEAFDKAIQALKIGMPWEKGVHITPIAEPDKPKYLNNLIQDALAKGAKIVNANGGQMADALLMPTVVYPVDSNMALYHEEQFGPVIPVVAFEDLNEPIQYLIKSDHGQQLAIFGKNTHQISYLIDKLVNQVARINLNTQCQRGPDHLPFTGRKDSAQGTLSIVDALKSFSLQTIVATKENPENKALLNEIMQENESVVLSSRFIF
jgi:glyceraldehyde-3-phosphate dehydrogenase (NADP+)